MMCSFFKKKMNNFESKLMLVHICSFKVVLKMMRLFLLPAVCQKNNVCKKKVLCNVAKKLNGN